MLPARVRHRDVPNEHPLVIQKILSHLNTKNDEVVELLPPTKSSTASDKSVLIKAVHHHKQNWFSQQWEALVLNSELRGNS